MKKKAVKKVLKKSEVRKPVKKLVKKPRVKSIKIDKVLSIAVVRKEVMSVLKSVGLLPEPKLILSEIAVEPEVVIDVVLEPGTVIETEQKKEHPDLSQDVSWESPSDQQKTANLKEALEELKKFVDDLESEDSYNPIANLVQDPKVEENLSILSRAKKKIFSFTMRVLTFLFVKPYNAGKNFLFPPPMTWKELWDTYDVLSQTSKDISKVQSKLFGSLTNGMFDNMWNEIDTSKLPPINKYSHEQIKDLFCYSIRMKKKP